MRRLSLPIIGITVSTMRKINLIKPKPKKERRNSVPAITYCPSPSWLRIFCLLYKLFALSLLSLKSWILFYSPLTFTLYDTVTHNVFQMFSDYQMQEMSENFIDSFGFQDDEFTDADMNIRLRDWHNDVKGYINVLIL